MSYRKLFEAIHGLNYVVQRNWETLPDSLPEGHGDLDLFVSERDREAVVEAVGGEELVDVRSPRDLYYPPAIAEILLAGRRPLRGMWVPSEQAHFISLYYHSAVHKTDDPYRKELRRLFLQMFPAIRCTDDGVGFHP